MSIPVALDALRTEMARYRPAGYLLSAGDGAPHVVSIAPEWNGDNLETTCGRRTATNVERQPAVALLFSPIDDGDYSLIVDASATARLDGEQWFVALAPQKAVLHRNATPDSPTSATGCGNDCKPL
jgi:hypothetical protein